MSLILSMSLAIKGKPDTSFSPYATSSNQSMANPRRFSISFSSTTTTVTYAFHDDQPDPQEAKQIPIQTTTDTDHSTPIPITLHVPHSPESSSAAAAAARIQAAYRAHVIRTLYKKVASVNSEADGLQRQIQRQETVDAVRSNEKEKVRMDEALMGLLLKLDSVPGVDPAVREARRKVSRRIVGLQEILDGICGAQFVGDAGDGSCTGGFWMRDWDEVLGEMEEEFCRERGGDEMERFCAQYLGFRCLQRFLREA